SRGRVAEGVHRTAPWRRCARGAAARHGGGGGARGGGGGVPRPRARRGRDARGRPRHRGGDRVVMDVLTGFRWQDALDILILAVLIYSGLNLIRGTRALPMLIGLGIVYAVPFLSGRLVIYTLNIILQNILSWSLVFVFLILQNVIRLVWTLVGT